MQSKIAVVIIAKNEEKLIGKTLDSLRNQDLKPYRTILVNDGSTDRTEEIALTYNEVEIVNRKNTGTNLQTKKELAETINVGLSKLKDEKDCVFIVKLDADIILPKNYLSTINERMTLNSKIAVSSGVIEGEYSVVPRGAGRVVRFDFWKKIGLAYPVNYGFEGYLLFKARSMGYEVTIFRDLVMRTGRKTGSTLNPKLYYNYGLGMKTVGQTFPYVLVRALIIAKKDPLRAFYLLRGFLSSYNDLFEPELREYVKKTQYKNIKNIRFRRTFNHLKMNIFRRTNHK